LFIFDLFRSFLPLHNPAGFGVADFIEIAFLLLMAAFLVAARTRVAEYARNFAERTGWCMLAFALLPIVLRLLLLGRFPVPTPGVSDDFSYLLSADTLLHFRLANPAHPLHQFFETFFVLQQPTYSSIFPLGQAIFLAIGRLLTGNAWAGVALTTGAVAALCYWMLRAWISPGWAFIGGLLAAIEFGPLSQWMNSFWGGAVSSCAGCLVFGALPRLKETGRERYAWLLGIGLALQILTRPFESVLLTVSAVAFLIFARPSPRRTLLVALVPVCAALAITALQNRAVTENWTTLPYQLSRYQYGVPTTFTFQPNPQPHVPLTPEQQLDYEIQSAVHGPATDTLSAYVARWFSRIRFYRFFLLAPLYLALPFAAFRLRESRFAWAAATVLLFSLGTNFYPYFYSHYIAAITCLLLLFALAGLERLNRITIRGQAVGQQAAALLLTLAGAHFLFWYGLHLFASDQVLTAAVQYETWDAINSGDPDGRIEIHRQLAATPGKHLVFVHYSPRHAFEEWVYNDADIDGSRVVWARDLGPLENAKLVAYYRDRKVWLLEPDVRPPRLTLAP